MKPPDCKDRLSVNIDFHSEGLKRAVNSCGMAIAIAGRFLSPVACELGMFSVYAVSDDEPGAVPNSVALAMFVFAIQKMAEDKSISDELRDACRRMVEIGEAHINNRCLTITAIDFPTKGNGVKN